SRDTSAEHIVILQGSKQRPVDLFAEDRNLRVKIIGSNKSGINLKPFSGHINDYYQLGRAEKAKVLFVVTHKKVTDEDRALITAQGMVLWSERELEYYDALTDAIGKYAKYEILFALGIHTREELDIHRLLALRIRQPDDQGRND